MQQAAGVWMCRPASHDALLGGTPWRRNPRGGNASPALCARPAWLRGTAHAQRTHGARQWTAHGGRGDGEAPASPLPRGAAGAERQPVRARQAGSAAPARAFPGHSSFGKGVSPRGACTDGSCDRFQLRPRPGLPVGTRRARSRVTCRGRGAAPSGSCARRAPPRPGYTTTRDGTLEFGGGRCRD